MEHGTSKIAMVSGGTMMLTQLQQWVEYKRGQCKTWTWEYEYALCCQSNQVLEKTAVGPYH